MTLITWCLIEGDHLCMLKQKEMNFQFHELALFFSALTMFINCGSVKWATRIQDTFTFGKLIALVILIVIGLIEVGSGEQKQMQV